ncbi:hypothetical protein QQ008_04760 [Fulvivirgaceae bacterium BMA10]|uniref:Uncharacterized protein n=1 Tax=Splendidivirga corallicola TaxID=3051826 RepID=A0ABT8KM73_9BACT|nr:hypothetical protein [Fulvivirgaceae bacterium BMA10]
MERVVKILMIAFGTALGFACLGMVLYEVWKGRYRDITLLIPLAIFLISVPSLIFHLKTLPFSVEEVKLKALDFESPARPHIKIGKIFWICNFIYALLILAFGIFAGTLALQAFPVNGLPRGWERYLLVLGFIFIGVNMIINEIKLIRVFLKRK